MSVLIAIIVFGCVVLVHEWGHFMAARRCGILVEEFAIGLGPKLFSVQIGETLYSIRMLPLGGFCQMLGDDADALADRNIGLDEKDQIPYERTLGSKTILQRMSVMFAGSFMNFVLAFLIFAVLVGAFGFRTTTIRHVGSNTPVEAAGLAPGDRITSINGYRIHIFEDLQFEVMSTQGRPLDIVFMRDGQRHNVVITPAHMEGRYIIGINPDVRFGLFTSPPEGFQSANIGEVITAGFFRVNHVIRTIFLMLIRMATGQTDIGGFAGPIGIVGMIGSQYEAVIREAAAAAAAAQVEISRAEIFLTIVVNMANLTALISANLAIINLFPLPALDGGRLVFLTLEAIRRKPIPPEREGSVHFAGFVVLMILAVYIAYQDILNLL